MKTFYTKISAHGKILWRALQISFTLICFFQSQISAQFQITHTIGDNDGFGFGASTVPDGANLPTTNHPDGNWFFDNRTPDDPSHNDYQLINTSDATYKHIFDVSRFSSIYNAEFIFDISGLQQEDGRCPPDSYKRSHLYFDGIEQTGFLDINQGVFGSGVYTFPVDISLLYDGILEIYFDQLNDCYDPPYGDVFSLDYTELKVYGTESSFTRPVLIFPSNRSTIVDKTPSFIWSLSRSSRGFTLLVDNDSSFGSPEINEYTEDTSYTPIINLVADTYFWKVQADYGEGGSWSEIWIITISDPIWIDFYVDMRYTIYTILEPGDKVGLRGSIDPLSWDQSIFLEDKNQTIVFREVVEFDIIHNGSELQYKYVIEKADSSIRWEGSVGPGGTYGNRVLLLETNPGIQYVGAYFDNISHDILTPTITIQPSDITLTDGQNATFTVSATCEDPMGFQWWQGHTPNQWNDGDKNGRISIVTSANSSTLTVNNATILEDNSNLFLCEVWNTIDHNNLWINSNVVTLTVTAVVIIPTITSHPSNQSVTAGQTATFSVVASGTAPLSYQWQKNNSNISGAINSTYTTPSTTSSDNGSKYRCIVSNSGGSVTSNAANLTVTAVIIAPTITSHPSNQSVMAGQTATFSVVANGTAPLSYQWQKNNSNISGAINSTYTTPSTTSSDNGSKYRCIVSNSGGSVASNEANLTVTAVIIAPTITSHPSNQSVMAGQTATFIVVANGTAPLSYQWQKNNSNISGAINSTYTTPSTTSSDNGSKYKCIVTNSGGSVTSNEANLTVTAVIIAPTITSHPSNQSVMAGQTATFSVVANGTAPLSYQWQKNNSNISGAINSTYTTPSTTPSDNGSKYRCIVSNSGGSVTSNAANLTVTAVIIAPTITSHPSNQSVMAGQTATFSVVANGTAPLSYQWQKNNSNISGATNSTYTTPSTTPSDNGSKYRCIVSNSGGSVTSNEATLEVTGICNSPEITLQPISQIIREGQSVIFSVTATGTTPFNYQWRMNGNYISGATSGTYTISSVSTNDDQNVYACNVSNDCGSITSEGAKLTVIPNVLPISLAQSFDTFTEFSSYRMIGLPGDINTSLEQILTGESGEFRDWRAFHDPGVGELIEFNKVDPLIFTSGRGFWILSKNDISFNDIINNVPLDEDGMFNIIINYEWNIITNPFNHDIFWEDIKGVNNVTSPIQYWNGHYVPQEKFEAYKAVYFFNEDQNRKTLKIPYQSNSLSANSFKKSALENEIKIVLLKGKIEISQISLGFNEEAKDGFDKYDIYAPPGHFANYQMSIFNENLHTNYKYLECDYRQNIGDGQIYEINLVLVPKEKVELFVSYQNYNMDSQILLIDKQTHFSFDLNESNKIPVITSNKSKNYILIIGNEEFTNTFQDQLIPDEYKLFQNYPNPFNLETTIRYGLPKDNEVILKLYDILGKEITILDNGHKNAGYHSIKWDGRNKNGMDLTSGIYIYRLNTANLSVTKKLILLK